MVNALVDAPAITVRLFAGIAEAAGTRDTTLLARTVGDAIALLQAAARDPAGFSRLIDRCTLHVGDARVTGTHRLAEGEQLAILPPFSGGAG